MAQVLSSGDELTLADLYDRFGPMPAGRIRNVPPPGMATEADLLRLADHQDRLCELVDGVLVEKTMGYYEAYLALRLASMLRDFVEARGLGIVTGADGMLRLFPGLVRIPDVAFVSWERLVERRVPRDPIADLAPDLAVEVLSKNNTAKEMARKLDDYSEAGVRLVWYVDHRPRTVTVYIGRQVFTVLHETDKLDGGDVLPGFALPIAELFAEPPGPKQPS